MAKLDYSKIFIKEACPTSIGGQAVMDGVMMQGPERTAIAMRLPSGELYLKTKLKKEQPKAMKYPFMQMKNGTSEELCSSDSAGTAENVEKYEICGSLCTVSDVIIRQVPLENPETGDILVFERTGAYSVTEGISLFLSRDLPRVYVKSGEKLTLIREQIRTEEVNYGRTY